MPLCGNCGTKDNKIETNDDGNCGSCGADDWVEWNDFFSKPSLEDYIEKKMRGLNLTLPQLVVEVYKSYDRLHERSVIEDVFERFNL